ncbi:MAG: hypothetical protein OEX12_03860 [Gammaproteobacteria bacterium]|nr:hypothetical protein [Gammaproteobacteria bacterium]
MNPIPSLLKLPSMLLLLAVLLGQAALFAHELGHAVEGDQSDCIICLLGDHQSALTTPRPLTLPQTFATVQYDTVRSTVSLQTRIGYSSRAPPLA